MNFEQWITQVSAIQKEQIGCKKNFLSQFFHCEKKIIIFPAK